MPMHQSVPVSVAESNLIPAAPGWRAEMQGGFQYCFHVGYHAWYDLLSSGDDLQSLCTHVNYNLLYSLNSSDQYVKCLDIYFCNGG